MSKKKEGLELLREPFPDNQIGKLPKPTKAQTDAVKNDFKTGVRCEICGGWHHPKVVHLDYVGHAALTDRLLDCDMNWGWEPVALTERGLPLFDESGGLWISLTVCGVSRIGYGHAASSSFKEVGSREKEVIGDALRNAAMRFGAALDLWHKGDLHEEEEPSKDELKPRFSKEQINSVSGTALVIISGLSGGDIDSALEAYEELTGAEKEYLWVAKTKGGYLTTEEKRTLKEAAFKRKNG